MEEVPLNKNMSINVLQLNWEQGHRKHSFFFFFIVKIQTESNRREAVTVKHITAVQFWKPYLS